MSIFLRVDYPGVSSGSTRWSSAVASWIISSHLHARGSRRGKELTAVVKWWLVTHLGWRQHLSNFYMSIVVHASFVGGPWPFSESAHCWLVFLDVMAVAAPLAPPVILMEVSYRLGSPLLASLPLSLGELVRIGGLICQSHKTTESLRVYVKFAHIACALPPPSLPPPAFQSRPSLSLPETHAEILSHSCRRREGATRTEYRTWRVVKDFFPLSSSFLFIYIFLYMKRSLKRETVREQKM